MEKIWHKVCTHYDVPEQVANAWYARIKQQLSADNKIRVYHNWHEMMLRKEEHLNKCRPEIVLAALFQYFHFDGNRSCVQQNCIVFEEFCRDAMIEDEESKGMILQLLGQKVNETELTHCYDDEANLLQDLDLAILAATPEDYKRYTQLLRQEYANLNDETYRIMRLKVVEALLMIPNIYATPEYQSKYENAARSNIRQEINDLKEH